MRIGFIVNKVATEMAGYTTTHLAYYSDGQMGAHARFPSQKKYRATATFLEDIQHCPPQSITAPDLDVLMLRNDPSEDIEGRPWAQNAGIVFGQLAIKQGVIVLNDPNSLSDAMNKMYFQHFPEKVRPKTIITRNIDDIRNFFVETKHKMVMKPLQGSGGRNVFLVTKKEESNINQMFEAICRDGYVIAQAYLPEAKDGDIRLFLMNGKPIIVDGKVGAIHRHQKSGEIRSNIHKGGSASKAVIDDTVMELVELVMPKLVEDGMFLVGLDIVGNKLIEINVFSPGGLSKACQLHGVDFFTPIIEAMERKVHYKKTYQETLGNEKIAVI